MEIDKEAGEVLRSLRITLGWSLGEVAKRTDGEYKASIVGAYERGERALTLDRFVGLVRLYGAEPSSALAQILGEKEDPVLASIEKRLSEAAWKIYVDVSDSGD